MKSSLGPPLQAAGVVRVGPLAAIPDLLEESGLDANEFLADYALTSDYFADPEHVLPFATAGLILKRAAEQTDIDHFGLLVGQRAGISSLGTVGYLMLSSPNVATALQMLAGYLHIHDGGAVVTLEVEDGFASLGYAILSPSIEGADQIYAGSIAIGANLLRELCGRAFEIGGVNLAHARPADTSAYRHVFGLSPNFDTESSSLVFPAEFLSRPLASADPVLHRLMADRARAAAELDLSDLVGRLRRVLRPLVAGPECTLRIVAGRMDMTARTLNRRLAEVGVTFREVRDEVRLAAAAQLLSNTRKTAYEIADVLGYSDASAFTRAFRRHHGKGPADWRKAARRGSRQAGGSS